MTRLLPGLIRFYRRRLSGRGPLKKVVCTFAACESCSAYGLRIADTEGIGTVEAARLIRARLRRCADAAVYRLESGYAWGRAHDLPEPEALDEVAVRARELPATRRALLMAYSGVAHYRGDRRGTIRARQLAQALEGGDERARLPLRDGRGFRAWLTRRLRLHLLVFAALVTVSAGLVALSPVAGALAGSAAGVATLASWRRHRERTDRFEQLAAATHFAAPPGG